MSKRIGFVVAWVLATVLAVGVGVVAVATVGASIRDRGPIGENVGLGGDAQPTVPATPAPTTAAVRKEITGEFGAFVVECRDTWAYGVQAKPATAQGWRVVSYEKGPDDDVDAVFSDGRNSVDLEVFCNQGQPTVAEMERNTLGDDDHED